MIGIVPQEIDNYAFDHTTPLPPVMEELRKATYESVPDAEMLSDRLIGTLLQTLIRVSGAKRILEIGTFTGFSALMMAHALPEDGELITCDIDPRPWPVSSSPSRPTAGRSTSESARPRYHRHPPRPLRPRLYRCRQD